MKRLRTWTLLALPAVCLGLACSSPKPEPETPASTPAPAPEPEPAVPAKAESSDALRTVSADATTVVRVRGDRLRSGPAFAAITSMRNTIPEMRQGLMLAQAGCGFDLVEAIQEIVIGARHEHRSTPDEPLGRMQLDPTTATAAILLNRPAEDALACIANFIPVEKQTIAGNPALVLPSGFVVQAHHELVIFTRESEAEAAMARIKNAAPLDPELQATLDANPEAAFLGFARGHNTLELKWGSVAVAQPAGGFDLKAIGLAEDAEAATKVTFYLEQELARLKAAVAQAGPEFQAAGALIDKVEVQKQDTAVSVHLALDKQQAETFFSDVLVKLVQEGVGKYANSAKTAEARDHVMRIALALSDHARAKRAKAPFPPSAPLSPAVVPGRRPADVGQSFEHPSWKAIGFAPTGPVYYAYQFVTAADGKSVEVIAEGDLDGDGVRSKYSVKVKMEGAEPRIDPDLTRQNPYE